ncbi:hypothetical protein BDY24DRAFT_394317 [Mrakia frigida]|uniref:uncharacterized protein n=1 Tax=Mrakia frigida TaxID=29902 RepID=UPI003FCBEECD
MYTSAASPGIKIARGILYGFLFISSIVLIVALTDTNAIGGELVKLEHPIEQPYPQPWPTFVPQAQTPTTEVAAVETGAVEKRNLVVHPTLVDALPITVWSATSAPSPLEDEPHPYPGWPPPWRVIQTHEICYLYERDAVKFLAIAGLVTSLSIVVVTFVLPTLGGTFLDFLSYFGLEALFTVLLFALWSVVAGFATKEAVELLQCSKRSRIAPLILTFAWLGFLSSLALAVGFLTIAIVENARGNKKIWTSRFQDFIFGEQAIRLPVVTSDDLAAPIVGSG